jgi:hypothetical protein
VKMGDFFIFPPRKFGVLGMNA